MPVILHTSTSTGVPVFSEVSGGSMHQRRSHNSEARETDSETQHSAGGFSRQTHTYYAVADDEGQYERVVGVRAPTEASVTADDTNRRRRLSKPRPRD